jgi:hypothetical protein
MAKILPKKGMKSVYMGDSKLKAPNVEIEWTPEDIKEFEKCATDVIYFIENYVKIINIDEGVVPFNLRDYQKDMVDIFSDNNRCICLLSRQVGKTVTSMAYILHYILFNTHKNVLILANRGETARGILSKLKEYYKNLPFFLQSGVVEWQKSSVELENGCRVRADGTSESAGRSESVALLYLDEFAFVPSGQAHDFMRAVYPTVSSSKTAKIIICSTCNGLNHYYKIWNDAINDRNEFVAFTVPWDAIPGRDEEFKRKTISNIGQEAWDVEYENKFLGSSGTLISGTVLSRLSYDEPISNEEYLKIYKYPEFGHNYILTVDPSEGLGQDYSVINITDVTQLPYEQVGVYRNDTIDPNIFPDIIERVARYYNNGFVLIEANNIGHVICNIMHNVLEYENLIRTEAKGRKGMVVSFGFGGSKSIVGVKTTPVTKRIGCAHLKSVIESDQYLIRDFTTIEELSTFSRKGNTYQAEDECHDDTCMALVLFSWLVHDDTFKQILEHDLRTNLPDGTHLKHLEESLLPFGFIDNGIHPDLLEQDSPAHLQNGAVWGWGAMMPPTNIVQA